MWGWVLEKVEARYAYSLVLMILGTSTLYLLTVDSVSGAFVAAALIGSVSAGSQVIPTLMYADYFGRNSLGKIRGISEIGVLLGQSTGPLLAGVVFDLNGSYSFVFLVFFLFFFVFFNGTAPPAIYTLSLHDALLIFIGLEINTFFTHTSLTQV